MSIDLNEVEGESPYADGSLGPRASSDLAVLVHFVLVFRQQINLSPFQLIGSKPESSILSRSGAVYNALLAFLASHSKRSVNAVESVLDELIEAEDLLQELREMVDKAMESDELRAATLTEEGRVLGSARLRETMMDAKGNGYVWLRGLDGCSSDRILRRTSGKREEVLRRREALSLVRRLEKGGKRDFVAAGWLKGRVERAKVRTKRVMEAEEERIREQERKEQERREKERQRELERIRKLARVKKQVGVGAENLGRGRRERKAVCYEEESDDEEEEEEEDEGEEFVLGAREGESEDEAEEESEVESEIEELDSGDDDVEAVAVGRVRVYSSGGGRKTRNSRRAAEEELDGGVRKSRRILRRNATAR